MAAPRDANIGGVEREKARRKVVRKKAPPKKPPILMPDMEATLRVPLQPLQPQKPRTAVERSVVYKPPGPVAPPAPHGGHVPILVAKAPIEDVIAPPKPGSIEDRKVKAYNQQIEKQRRADARAERAARD